MVLDFIEIVSEVEEQLSINFENNDFQDIITVGDFYNLPISKIDFPKIDFNIRLKLLDKLRYFCEVEFNSKPENISYNTPLNEIFLSPVDEDTWQHYSKMLQCKLPPLVCSSRAKVYREFSTVLVSILMVMCFVGVVFSHFKLAAIFFILALALLCLDHFFIKEIHLPSYTVSQFVDDIVQCNSTVFMADDMLNSDDVWFVIRKTISEHQGIPIDKITKEVKIVDELGID